MLRTGDRNWLCRLRRDFWKLHLQNCLWISGQECQKEARISYLLNECFCLEAVCEGGNWNSRPDINSFCWTALELELQIFFFYGDNGLYLHSFPAHFLNDFRVASTKRLKCYTKDGLYLLVAGYHHFFPLTREHSSGMGFVLSDAEDGGGMMVSLVR